MKLTITEIEHMPGLLLRKVGAWFYKRTPEGAEWIYETHYYANRERLTKVDRSKPTAHADSVRQWRAMRKGGVV